MAVDHSETSDRAMRAARDLALLSQGEVWVLHLREREMGAKTGVLRVDETKDEANAKMAAAIKMLNRAAVKAHGEVSNTISGYAAQRLSVARAVLTDRPVLLLDEPTRHLDATTADAVLGAVLERAADRPLLWITHRPEELAAFPEACHLRADPGTPDRPPDR